MRITNNMLVNNMMNNLGNNLTRMDKYQNQLATGKRIQVPSDDPVVAARALKLRTDVSEIDQYKRNTSDAQSWMDITETALGNIGDVLQRARELAVQGANSSNTPSDLQKIAAEVKQLKGQTIQMGNMTYAGRYVFSGFKTDKPLLNPDGTFAIDVKNSEGIKFEIGIGDNININVQGGDLFNNGANAVGDVVGSLKGNTGITFPLVITTGSNDTLGITVDGETVSAVMPAGTYTDSTALAAVLQTDINSKTTIAKDMNVSGVGNNLIFTSGSQGTGSSISINPASNAVAGIGLSATTVVAGAPGQVGSLMANFDKYLAALNSGDNAAVGGMISTIDMEMNNILRIRADIGARQNRIDLTANRLDSDNINFTKLMSQNEDVDMSETIMNLQNEENVYKASLAGGAKVIQPSLVDFLR